MGNYRLSQSTDLFLDAVDYVKTHTELTPRQGGEYQMTGIKESAISMGDDFDEDDFFDAHEAID